ncbi:hypothetical protein BIY24_02630 [Halobacteriovorax marinus]|uniref:hypothetical protein n=1 Tax=Halobacteriovorax marinus TaxID=97084 RepID=UPI000BC3365C|nr:hypothetical protein [Halobacteriovorax marinus]ATH06868.1 hypothetical protein BIY24_02630 [Halobacteriovorax marinus]
MISVKEIESNIFEVEITSPRETNDETTFLGLLDDLIARNYFGLIFSTEGKAGFSPEAKKEMSTWFKKNKPILKDRCVGFARVNTSQSKAARFTSKAMKLAMPCPYHVVTNNEDAREWLLNLLSTYEK